METIKEKVSRGPARSADTSGSRRQPLGKVLSGLGLEPAMWRHTPATQTEAERTGARSREQQRTYEEGISDPHCRLEVAMK